MRQKKAGSLFSQNKMFSQKYFGAYSDQQAPDEGQRAQRPKRRDSNKVENNSPSVDNDNSSSQKRCTFLFYNYIKDNRVLKGSEKCGNEITKIDEGTAE